jgi:hypothetical protein
MKARKVIAYPVGIAGCASIAYGLHGVMSFGCTDTAESCTADVGGTLPFLIGGIFVTVFSMIAGATLLFPLLFLSIGLGSIVAGAQQDETFPIMFGGIFAVAALLPLIFLLKARSFMGGLDLNALTGLDLNTLVGSPSKEVVDDLLENGIPAVATILSIRDTGMRINDNPRVTLRARLEPVDGNPYEAEKTLVMSLVQPFQVGARIPALIYPDDHGKFGLIVDVSDPSKIPPRLRGLIDQVSAPVGDFATQLERVHGLHRSGALSDAEFAEAKARILRK